jgi:hypothetical protein
MWEVEWDEEAIGSRGCQKVQPAAFFCASEVFPAAFLPEFLLQLSQELLQELLVLPVELLHVL